MNIAPDQSAELQKEFPQFLIWRETIGQRARYVARSTCHGLNPHTVVTGDPAELRAALEEGIAGAEPGTAPAI